MLPLRIAYGVGNEGDRPMTWVTHVLRRGARYAGLIFHPNLMLLVLGGLVFLLAWTNVELALAWKRLSPIWVANAVWLTFVLRAAPRRTPWLLASGFLGNMAASLSVAAPWPIAAVLSGSNLFEVWICAFAVRRLLGGRIDVSQPRELLGFGMIAAVASAISACAGGYCVAILNREPTLTNWGLWFLADVLGLMLLTPLMVSVRPGDLRRALRRPQLIHGARVAAAAGGSLALVGLLPQHPLLLALPPVLVFATLELEFVGAAVCMLVFAGVCVEFIGLGWTPYWLDGRSLDYQILSLQALLVVATFVTFPLAAALKRRRELEAELTRSRDSLAEANRQAKLAEKLAGIGYWRVTAPERRFEWSEQMYQIYGRDPADGPPTLPESASFVHPDDHETLANHRRSFGDGEAPELEVRIVRPSGEVRHVIARSAIERDAEGRIVARFGTCTDITDIKLAEAAARQSEERYRFLADNAPDMISRTKLGGEIVYISPGSENVFGYTPEEMAQQNAQDMVHPEDFERVMGGIFTLINQRRFRLDEPLCYRAKHKNGDWIWIETNPTLICDERGEPIEFIDVVRNVTQTKTFEAELEEARRRAEAGAAAKSAFLANMSHELRTPLTSIIGFSRLLGDREELATEARHYARRISDASEALLAIINDVLDFSKLEAGQVALEVQPLSVRRLVDETTGLVTIQAAAKGLKIETELDPATPEMITGDVARLRQVLVNFLSNAVKFTEAGQITIRTAWREKKGGARLRIAVTDTGGGIAPQNVGRLFERFSQAEVSINRTHGGTGLGLAISKGIVELMGGRIGVKTKLGKGSTFWIEIPAEAAAAPAAPAQTHTVLDCPPLRILVVDDTPVNRELVKLMLNPLGFEIEEASDGAEGVKAAMTKPYDLILMDVRMPGVDGLEATRVIRATSLLNGKTPILALTADVQPENASACRAAGMDDILAKPISPQELLTKVVQWGVGGAAAEPGEAKGAFG